MKVSLEVAFEGIPSENIWENRQKKFLGNHLKGFQKKSPQRLPVEVLRRNSPKEFPNRSPDDIPEVMDFLEESLSFYWNPYQHFLE